MSERAAIRKMHRYSEESAQRPKSEEGKQTTTQGGARPFFFIHDGSEGFIIEALMTIFKASV